MRTLTAAILLLAAGAARAEKPWKNTAELTFVNTGGNSDGTTVGAKDDFRFDWDKTALELGAGLLNVTANGQKTAERYHAREKVERKISEKGYLFQKLRWDQDKLAGVNSRYDVSGGLDLTLLKTEADLLKTEAGAGYVREDRIAGPLNDFSAGQASLRYERKWGEAVASQDVGLTANFENSSDYRLATVTALTAPVSAHVSLKASFEWNRVNAPPAGFKKSDTQTSAALIIGF